MFRALVLEKEGDAAVAHLRELDESALPAGDVTVAVEYSTLNYKDGLALSANGGGIVRAWPHVGGIDFAGVVEASSDSRYAPGDKVVLTGWRVGEVHWGGYAQKARVKADWLVPLPGGLTTRQAMAVGTAGFTAMLAVMALEDHGLTPAKGEVLVTGAAGGVGSVAVAILAQLGYQVAAVTGRPETEGYLRDLGATRIVPRAELAETVKRPLETETWAGCVDAVGGAMLARGAGADEIRRLGCGCRACRGGRVACECHSVPVAGGEPAGDRFRIQTLCRPGARLGADRDRPADGQAGGDDAACCAGGPAGLGRGDPERRGAGRVVVNVNG